MAAIDKCRNKAVKEYKNLYNCITEMDSMTAKMKESFDLHILRPLVKIKKSILSVYDELERIQSVFNLESGLKNNFFEMVKVRPGETKKSSLLRLNCAFLIPFAEATVGKSKLQTCIFSPIRKFLCRL